MAESQVSAWMSVDADATFDQLVCRVSGQLEKGKTVDISELLQAHPEHAERLRKLLPTLQAIAELRPSDSDNNTSSAGLLDSTISGVLGDFRILREIGRGGMGVVYEAEQISLARRVAVKILPFASVMDPRRMHRFQNEARAAASLHHPHIVPVYFVGSERGVHFYAMQLIHGQSLDQVIRENRNAREANVLVSGMKTSDQSPEAGEAVPLFTVEQHATFQAQEDGLATASVWTRRAGGNDGVSMMVTLITNASCFLVMPFWIYLQTGQELAPSMLINTVYNLFFFVVVPIAIGQTLRINRQSANWATKHKPLLSGFALVGILIMVLIGSVNMGLRVDDEAGNISWFELIFLAAFLGAVHIAVFWLAIYTGQWLGLRREEWIPMGFAGSQKTLMIGLSVAITLGFSIIPIIVYHSIQLIVDAIFADQIRAQQPEAR